jgi:hypothetical protein
MCWVSRTDVLTFSHVLSAMGVETTVVMSQIVNSVKLMPSLISVIQKDIGQT